MIMDGISCATYGKRRTEKSLLRFYLALHIGEGDHFLEEEEEDCD